MAQATDCVEGSELRFFHRQKNNSLSQLQGVPSGTFRCDVCTFVLPHTFLYGSAVDSLDKPPTTYILCSICVVWLRFGRTSLTQALRFRLSENQHAKIIALHKELDTAKKDMALLYNTKEIGKFLKSLPNLREVVGLRSSMLREDILEISDKLSRGESVDPFEINKANG